MTIRIDELVSDIRTVAIGGHIRPDGDCIGSCLGMYLYLTQNHPDLRVDLFLQEVPEEYRILKGWENIRTDYQTDVDSYDLFICQDCGKERLGDAEVIFDKAANTLNIDHHISNAGTGRLNYLDPKASSACELVYDCLDPEKITTECAMALYTGMVTDTGVFKYNNTSRKTMETAGKLITYGFEHGVLIDQIFYQKTYLQNQIMGRALLESILFMDGRCILTVISRQTMEFYQATSNDLDGIVNQLLLTKGVSCAVFMYEIGNQEYKVSLRSDGKVNVAKIAELFGGGGHERAAGCTMSGTSHDIVNSLSQYIEQQLDGAGNT